MIAEFFKKMWLKIIEVYEDIKLANICEFDI